MGGGGEVKFNRIRTLNKPGLFPWGFSKLVVLNVKIKNFKKDFETILM